MPDMHPDPIEQAVRQVLGSLTGDMTSVEASLLAELEALGREVQRAKSDIASMRVDDINASHIPRATDELDAVVEHTATATNEILDVCEGLEAMQMRLPAVEADKLGAAVTRIYEACSFQDITGQRIAKVVGALKAIEARVTAVTARFANTSEPLPLLETEKPATGVTEGRALANGPQMPGLGTSQADIDKLLASFD